MTAEMTTSQQHTLLNSGLASSYSISFNLSSLFTYPSRFLAKFIHKGDSITENLADTRLMSSTTTSWIDSSESLSTMAAAAATATSTTAAKATATASTAFPGPWGFFSSGYMCGLLIMGVLMHRIDNIFVPTTPHAFHHYPAHIGPLNRGSWSRSLLNRFLPIDISRTSTRLAIHLPTIYLMCRVLLLWGIMLLQTADLFPWTTQPQTLADSDSGNLSQNVFNILYRLGKWCASWETEDVCWHTFCAICAAFCVEGFVKGLDGNGHGFGFGFAEHMQANTSPFNLVGYAFLLHIYSSPLTHAFKPYNPDFSNLRTDSELSPSRPDTHVLITLAIPLFQLTLFHLLSVQKRWSRHRLLPTALTSMLSLLHFHVTLARYLMGINSTELSSPSPAPSTIPSPYPTYASPSPLPVYTYTPHHTTHGYPILNYIPNIFETLLISTIFLTIFLNTLTQLLITGRVDKPLLGLGIGTHSGSGIETSGGWMGWMREMMEMFPWDEDFGVVLLRVGTASLEATGMRGWGNEVGGIVASSLPSEKSGTLEPRKYGTVHLTRTGVVGVSSGSVTATVAGRGRHGKEKAKNSKGKDKMKLLEGWNNEVREVDLGSNSPSTGRRQYGINGILTLNAQWFTEMRRFLKSVWVVVLGAAKLGLTVGWEVLRGRRKLFRRHTYGNARRRVQDELQNRHNWETSDQEEDRNDAGLEEETEEKLYEKFLRGGSVTFESDDEDQDYNLSDVDQDSGEEDSITDEVESDSREELEETIHLYADLSNQESTPEENGPSTTSTLLAHMSYSGSNPLTRRRYASLHKSTHTSEVYGEDTSPGDALGFQGITQGDRTSVDRSVESDDARRNCVICTTEARVIICWPCRCLAMCDSCRESLAARSSASKHRCPCCRRGVEGYSRIYIP